MSDVQMMRKPKRRQQVLLIGKERNRVEKSASVVAVMFGVAESHVYSAISKGWAMRHPVTRERWHVDYLLEAEMSGSCD